MSRLRANQITNEIANGAPNFPHGLTVTGIVTASTLNQTPTSIVVGSAVTANSQGIDVTGIVTATSFKGAATNLTSIPAANLTGTAAAINGSNITNLPAANLTGTLPAISGANLTGVVNLVANTTATEQSLTASASIISADIVLSKNNPYLVILGVVSLNTRTASNLDNENIKFDLEYSTNGGSSYSGAVGDVYATDVFAPGQDDTHSNQYDIDTRPANGRFQITANAGTTVRIRILLDYSSVQSSRTIYINRGASGSGQGTSSILIYEE